MSVSGSFPPFFFFGLSGAGKTTLINEVCQGDSNYSLSPFTVTRPPRPDDDATTFEYVSVEIFKNYRRDRAFYIDDDDGTNFYGYRTANLKPVAYKLFYGLPAKVDEIVTLGAKCILVQATASVGLQMRGDETGQRLRRESSNRKMSERFYQNPTFLQKMDLILLNSFSGIKRLALIVKHFTYLTTHETYALSGNLKSLKYVLKVHYHPFPELVPHFSFWLSFALKNSKMSYLYYSRVLSQNLALNCSSKSRMWEFEAMNLSQ